MRNNLGKKLQIFTMILSFLTFVTMQPAMADMVPTNQLINSEQTSTMRNHINALLVRDDVAASLVNMGVDVDQAKVRVLTMTDLEVQTLYDQLEVLPAGEGGLGTIALLLFILILLDIAGVTDIFPAI